MASHSSESAEIKDLQNITYMKMVNKFTQSKAIDDTSLIILTAAYAVLIIVGVTGNGLVCAAVARKPTMRTGRNVYIINLAVSDLLLCLITMPFSLVEISVKFWPLGKPSYPALFFPPHEYKLITLLAVLLIGAFCPVSSQSLFTLNDRWTAVQTGGRAAGDVNFRFCDQHHSHSIGSLSGYRKSDETSMSPFENYHHTDLHLDPRINPRIAPVLLPNRRIHQSQVTQ